MERVTALALTCTVLLLALSSDLRAQDASVEARRQLGAGQASGWPTRSSVVFDLSIGLLTPLGNLTPDEESAEVTEIDPALQLSTGVALAGGATLFLGPKVGLAVHGSWASADVDQKPLPGGGPNDEQPLGGADHLTATLGVIYRLLDRPLGALDPYVSAGVGLRRVSFSFDDPRLEDATDPMVTLGAGVRAFLRGRVHWTLDVRDGISMFEPADAGSRLQNDLIVTVGFGARL